MTKINTSRYSVKFYQDAIAIVRDNDEEILYWIQDEWEEDSEVVFSVANAIRLAYTNPEKLERKAIWTQKDEEFKKLSLKKKEINKSE